MTAITSYTWRGERVLVTCDAGGGGRAWTVRHGALHPHSVLAPPPPPGTAAAGAGPGRVDAAAFEPRVGCLLTLAAAEPAVRAWDTESGACTGVYACPAPPGRRPAAVRGAPGAGAGADGAAGRVQVDVLAEGSGGQAVVTVQVLSGPARDGPG